MWIHEHQDWPNFLWDADALAPKLADIRREHDRLLADAAGLGAEIRRKANLEALKEDVVKSSAIEGVMLNPDHVRSSLGVSLGFEKHGTAPANPDIDGIVDITIDVARHHASPLTARRLFNWHTALFPTGLSDMQRIKVGDWRGDEFGAMQVVSGPLSARRVHFEAPDAERLEGEMRRFLDWFNGEADIDPLLKAGVAHLWFVTIHPFDDGNGRIARAIGDLALAREDGMSQRLFSMSAQIERLRRTYYIKLEHRQRGALDVTDWLEWFLDCLGQAIPYMESHLVFVVFKAEFWRKIDGARINERQRLVLKRMFADDFRGHMNAKKYAKMARCSHETALGDIDQLLDCAALLPNSAPDSGGGRVTSYRLPDARHSHTEPASLSGK